MMWNRKTMKQSLKRTMLVFLSAALTLGLVASPGSFVTAYASTDKTVACFGVKSIKDPAPGAADKEWTGSYVWYGAYDGIPVRYRVLNVLDTPNLFLDCDSVLFRAKFDNDGNKNDGATKVNEWQYSDIRNSLNGDGFLTRLDGFSLLEKNAIVQQYIDSHQITKGAPGNVLCPNTARLYEDTIFLLDYEDTVESKYGYCEDCGYAETDLYFENPHPVDCKKKKEFNGSISSTWADDWLLRTGTDSSSSVGYIVGGKPSYRWGSLERSVVTEESGISPAFYVNKKEILFSSVVPGTENGEYADYKLTIKDPNLTIWSPYHKATRTGRKVTIPYEITGSKRNKVTQVSVMIVDGEQYGTTNGVQLNPTLRYYGKLNIDGAAAASEKGTFNLPSEFDPDKWGKDYWVYIIADTVNGEHETDYASEPYLVYSPTVVDASEYTVTVNNDGNGTATASVQKGVTGTTVTLTATPYAGYKFKKWEVISGGVTVDNNTFAIDSSDVEIKAVFEEISDSFSVVSFDSNGGTGSMYKIYVEKNTSFALPTCTFTAPSGKEFDKWDIGAAGSMTKVSGDTIIKAIWKDKTVTTDPSAGTPEQGKTEQGKTEQGAPGSKSGDESKYPSVATVTPPAAPIFTSKPKNSKSKTISLKWKAVSDAAGYEVQYSLKKNFKKGTKTKATTKTKLTIKKLKKGKTYYVRVRAYKKDATGKKIFGKWSKKKSVKVKK